MMHIRKVKSQIRVIGFDDGTFTFSDKVSGGRTIVVGVVMKGSTDVLGVVSRWLTVDGTDATSVLAEAVNSSRFKDVRVIMLKGITYGGFNVVDVNELSERTSLPIVVVIRKRPDLRAIESALRKHFSDAKRRIEIIRKAPPLRELIPGRLYYQCVGMSPKTAEEVIRVTTRNGLIPEPLRLAHMVASAVMTGESKKE